MKCDRHSLTKEKLLRGISSEGGARKTRRPTADGSFIVMAGGDASQRETRDHKKRLETRPGCDTCPTAEGDFTHRGFGVSSGYQSCHEPPPCPPALHCSALQGDNRMKENRGWKREDAKAVGVSHILAYCWCCVLFFFFFNAPKAKYRADQRGEWLLWWVLKYGVWYHVEEEKNDAADDEVYQQHYHTWSRRSWKDAPEDCSLNTAPGQSFFFVFFLSFFFSFNHSLSVTSCLIQSSSHTFSIHFIALVAMFAMLLNNAGERGRKRESLCEDLSWRERISHNTPQMCLSPK